MTEDSFEKMKKGFKGTAEGLKEAGKGFKEGLEETAEGVKEGVEDTAKVVDKGVEGTADVFEDTAKQATDSDTYTGSEDESQKRHYKEPGGKEPMNPNDIASHEPTAVKRDKRQGTSGDPV